MKRLFRLLTPALVAAAFLAFAAPAWAAPGDLDTTFGSGGKVITDIKENDHIHAIAIQPDGKVVAAGYVSECTPQSCTGTDFVLARYNPNGSLDTSFGANGKSITDFGYGWINDVAIQPDGKIVVAGTTNARDSQDFDFALARYNPNGTLDTSFDEDGMLLDDFNTGDRFDSEDHAKAVAIQSDGKIMAAGHAWIDHTGPRFALARYHPDGSPDTSFGGNGKLVASLGSVDSGAEDVAIQPDGKIVAAGYGCNDFYWVCVGKYFALARFDSDGTLDTTFHGNGKILTGFGSGSTADNGNAYEGSHAYALAIQPNGKLVVSGRTANYNADTGTTPWDFALARYNADGSLDTNFDGDGKVETSFVPGNDEASSLALQPDGKIVAAGRADLGRNHFAIARLNSNGSSDTNFAGDGQFGEGKVVTNFGFADDWVRDIALQTDGKILAAGELKKLNGDEPLLEDFALARYHGDGSSSSDITAPTVSLTTPANNAVVQGTSVTLSADASDNVGVSKVEFLVNGSVIVTDSSAPYSAN